MRIEHAVRKKLIFQTVQGLAVTEPTKAIFRTEHRAETFARRFGKGFEVAIQPLQTPTGPAFEVLVTYLAAERAAAADGLAKDE